MSDYSIFITGAFKYPDKDAAGKRINQIVSALESFQDCREITVGGWEEGSLNTIRRGLKTSSLSFSLLKKNEGNIFLKSLHFLFMGLVVISWMFENRGKFSVIYLYNPPFIFSVLSLCLAKCLNKKIILDSTEWYQSEHLPGGTKSAAALENWARMKISYPHFKNVIAISDYLYRYYDAKGNNIIKVPPLAKTYNKHTKVYDSDKVTLFYAGSPGKKDRIDVFLKSLVMSKHKYPIIYVYIAGVNEETFLRDYPFFQAYADKLKMFCCFLGRLDIKDIYMWYEHVDYCFFFREHKRYAHAGFPSKFVEALSYGIPVITNKIGDISDVLPEVGYEYEPDRDDINDLLTKLQNKDLYEKKKENTEIIFTSDYLLTANISNIQHFFRKLI